MDVKKYSIILSVCQGGYSEKIVTVPKDNMRGDCNNENQILDKTDKIRYNSFENTTVSFTEAKRRKNRYDFKSLGGIRTCLRHVGRSRFCGTVR